MANDLIYSRAQRSDAETPAEMTTPDDPPVEDNMPIRAFEPKPMKLSVLTAALQELTPRFRNQ
jgi:hypothetical protein